MLEIIKDLPENVIGVRAKGEVKKEDLETVVIPAVDEAVEKAGTVNYLLVMETDLSNWNLSALIADARLSFKHYTKWKRIAIVSDQESLREAVDGLSPAMHGETRTFPLIDLATATGWVSTAA